MKIKTSELTGTALDWAVAKCEGVINSSDLDIGFVLEGGYTPSTDWAQGGPIIERERIELHCWDFHSLPWKAAMWWDDEDSSAEIQVYGTTPLIAAMRCYVASKMGAEVNVPDELKGVKK